MRWIAWRECTAMTSLFEINGSVRALPNFARMDHDLQVIPMSSGGEAVPIGRLINPAPARLLICSPL
jgi:hypothetical protein